MTNVQDYRFVNCCKDNFFFLLAQLEEGEVSLVAGLSRELPDPLLRDGRVEGGVPGERVVDALLEEGVHDVNVEPDAAGGAQHEEGRVRQHGQQRVAGDGEEGDQHGEEDGAGHHRVHPKVDALEAHDHLEQDGSDDRGGYFSHVALISPPFP